MTRHRAIVVLLFATVLIAAPIAAALVPASYLEDDSGNAHTLTQTGDPSVAPGDGDADTGAGNRYGEGVTTATGDSLTASAAAFEASGAFTVFIVLAMDDTAAATGDPVFRLSTTAGLSGEYAELFFDTSTDAYQYRDDAGVAGPSCPASTVTADELRQVWVRAESDGEGGEGGETRDIQMKVYDHDGTALCDVAAVDRARPESDGTGHAAFLPGDPAGTTFYEARYWTTAISIATLDSMADPDNTTFAQEPEGTEEALWLLGDDPGSFTPVDNPDNPHNCTSPGTDRAGQFGPLIGTLILVGLLTGVVAFLLTGRNVLVVPVALGTLAAGCAALARAPTAAATHACDTGNRAVEVGQNVALIVAALIVIGVILAIVRRAG